MLRFTPDVLFKTRPIHLTLFVTRRCNARCPFCFYAPPEESASEPEISLEELTKISRSLGSLLWLSFSGGEIFLRKDIADTARQFYKNNRPSIILLSTNALLTDTVLEKTEQILQQCPKSTVVVKLSLDGVEERHDEIRGLPDSFRKVMATYNALGALLDKYQNFELGINTVFSAENQDDMDEIIDFVRGLDRVKTHTISLVRGDTRLNASKEVDIDKYLQAISRLEEGLLKGSSPTYRFRGARLKAAQDILQRSLIYRTVVEERRQIECFAGRLNLVITENADIYPCETFTPEMKLANLRNFDFDVREAMKSPRARGIISGISDHCFCTHECFMMTNILFNPGTYPALLEKYVRVGKS